MRATCAILSVSSPALLFSGCSARTEGAVEGSVVSQAAVVKVAALPTSSPLTVGEAFLFSVPAPKGEDWSRGMARATGLAKFPASVPKRLVAGETAKHAASTDARRTLFLRLSGIAISPEHTLSDALRTSLTVWVAGFVGETPLVAERDRNDGVAGGPEAPLTGRDRLSSALPDL